MKALDLDGKLIPEKEKNELLGWTRQTLRSLWKGDILDLKTKWNTAQDAHSRIHDVSITLGFTTQKEDDDTNKM